MAVKTIGRVCGSRRVAIIFDLPKVPQTARARTMLEQLSDGAMTELRIDRDKAQRIMAEVLRADAKMQPGKANELATQICGRLRTSMATPTKPGLRGYRIIEERPSREQSEAFIADVKKFLADVDKRTAEKLWELVYNRGRAMPDDIAL